MDANARPDSKKKKRFISLLGLLRLLGVILLVGVGVKWGFFGKSFLYSGTLG